jgi:hypothetical protein
MPGDRSIPTRTCIAIIFGIVAAMFVPMAVLGIPDGYDLMQHMRFASSYEHAIVTGEIIPKWGGHDNFGFGSIGVRYYPPLAYLVIALTHIVTGDWYTSFWLTSFGWILAGSLGIFFWISEHGSNTAALAAAVIYLALPFHSFEIYHAVLYSEFAATGLLPFCFLFLTRVCLGRRWSDVGFLGIFCSLLLLTHIPSAMIGAAGMVIYALAMIEWRRISEYALKLGTCGIFVLAATAFHYAKAIPELQWVQHNAPRYFAQGSYDYRSLLFPIYYSAPYLRYVQKILWTLDVIVVLTIVFLVVGGVVLFVSRKSMRTDGSRLLIAILVTGAASLFMLSIASVNIWDALPTLQKIQFPWRWLELISLMTAAVTGLAAPKLLFRNDRLWRPGAYSLLGLLLVICLFDVSQLIIPSSPLSKAEFQQKIDEKDSEEACDCWWPIWARREAFEDRSATAGNRTVSITSRDEEHITVAIAPGDPSVLRLPIFYHPYWHALVDGAAPEVLPDPNGAVTLEVPTVATHVQLDFVEPYYLAPLRYLALIAWVGAFLFLVMRLVRRLYPGHR